jgi:IS4 transposase
MLLDSIFRPFVERRPVCVMARAVLERVLDPIHIDALFERTAERQYTRHLLFSSVVDLMAQVVVRLQPSVHAAYQALEDRMGVSDQAVYNKLQSVEPRISAELVRDSAQQVRGVVRELGATFPSWLPRYRVKVLDGNHLSATEHRIDELRTLWDAPLPGKVLVVLDQAHMLATKVFLTEDGHAQERSLLNDVLDSVEAGDLWIADRNFCTIRFIFGIFLRRGAFLIRQHGTVKGELIGTRKACGRCSTGRVYEQALRLKDADGTAHVVRRITIVLNVPTRDGDTELHLLTNTPAETANAAQLAELYRERWTIETVFLELQQTLECEINTLGYPKAALFAFCLALMVFNAVSLVKAALRAVHGRKKVDQEVSGYYLSLEIQHTYDGMMIAVPGEHWAIFRDMTDAKFARILEDIAGHVNLSKYRKHPRGPKKPPPKKTKYKNGGHVATARLLAGRKK